MNGVLLTVLLAFTPSNAVEVNDNNLSQNLAGTHKGKVRIGYERELAGTHKGKIRIKLEKNLTGTHRGKVRI